MIEKLETLEELRERLPNSTDNQKKKRKTFTGRRLITQTSGTTQTKLEKNNAAYKASIVAKGTLQPVHTFTATYERETFLRSRIMSLSALYLTLKLPPVPSPEPLTYSLSTARHRLVTRKYAESWKEIDGMHPNNNQLSSRNLSGKGTRNSVATDI